MAGYTENNTYIADGKEYTRTTLRRRTIKLKEWGINESIFRTAKGSSGEKIYQDEVFFINTDQYGCISNENGIEERERERERERIAVLSGSFGECMFMKATERLISVAERLLNERLHTHTHTHTHTESCSSHELLYERHAYPSRYLCFTS